MSGTREAPVQLLLPCCAEEGNELHALLADMKRRDREKGKGGCTPDTLKARRKVVRILESLGVRTFAGLADPTLDRRFDEWTASRGWEASTRNLYQGHLHSIIRFAAQRELLPSEPELPSRTKPGGRRWRQEHPPTTRFRPPAPADRSRLEDHLEAADDTRSGLRLWALVMIEAETEIPLAAALRLTPADVDLAFLHRIRYSRRRGGSPRHAPLSHRLETVLWMWLAHCGPRWVFPDRTRSAPWSAFSARMALRDRCRAAGTPPITFEQLRRHPAARDPIPALFGLADPRHATILEAAATLLQRGEPITVTRICELAGVSRSNLYERHPELIALIELLAKVEGQKK